MKKRTSIPRPIKRLLLVEAGFKCSIRYCTVDSALEFHHIDSNPSNNLSDNILVVCSNHHALCSQGKIDKKACRVIKKALEPKMIKISTEVISEDRFRKVLRQELFNLIPMANKVKVKQSALPSALDHKHLFKTLDRPQRSIFETYFAIRALGAMKPRGATQRIIAAVLTLYKDVSKLKPNYYGECYRAAIKSLSQIDTRDALKWLSSEFLNRDQDEFHQFIIFIALSGSANAEKHLRFKIINAKNDGKSTGEILFTMKGQKYKFEITRVKNNIKGFNSNPRTQGMKT